MIVTCFDLEMNQPSNTIIQIGWVIGNVADKKKEILFRDCITLKVAEEIAPKITKLTGITSDNVKFSTYNIAQAYEEMAKSHLDHGAFMNPFTWGCGDTTLLHTQLKERWANHDDAIGLTPCRKEWVFGRRWNDVKAMYIAQQLRKGGGQKSFQGGLKKSLHKVGLKFQGTAHDAGCDAENTFEMLYRVINEPYA